MFGILGNKYFRLHYKWFPKNWILVRISGKYEMKTVVAINNKIVPDVVNLPIQLVNRFGFPSYEVYSVYREHCGHPAQYLYRDEWKILRCGICNIPR
jgi:hypothetical protein